MRRPPADLRPTRPGATRAVVLPVVAALLVTAGCGTSGRALREPNRDAIAPTRSTAATTSSTYPPTSLQLVAEGFEPGAAVPPANSCGGGAPTLRWRGVPEGTVELALAFVDFDEADRTARIRWLVAGVPPTGREGSLAEGAALPPGAFALANGQGATAYAGPCDTGERVHTYNFMVFALPEPSGLAPDAAPAEAFDRLESIAKGDIAYYTGTAQG